MSSTKKKIILNKRLIDANLKKRSRQLHANLKRVLMPYSIMFLLKVRSHYALEVRKKLSRAAEGYTKVANNVVYDHLNKFAKEGIVESFLKESSLGPARKYYSLTEYGNRVFQEIIAKELYPNMYMFLNMMEAMMQEHEISHRISKKDLNKFQNLISEVINA